MANIVKTDRSASGEVAGQVDRPGPGRPAADAWALGAGVVAGAWLAPCLPEPAVQPATAAVGAAGLVWAGLSLRRRAVSLRAIGLRLDDLHRSGAVFLASAAALVAGLAIAGRLDLESPGKLADPRAVAGYFLWATFQQFLAVSMIWRHLAGPLGRGESRAVVTSANVRLSVLTASLFALVHAPNPGLMALVGLAEAVWILLFARFRNLFALAAAHAVSALAVAEAMQPSWLLSSTKVGLGYLLARGP